MRHSVIIDDLLPMNLVAMLKNSEEQRFTQQKELLFVAFEHKILLFNKQELLTMKSYMKTYIAIEPGAGNDIFRTYIKLINLHLKKAN